jgi:hypothetical protein
VQLDQKHHQQIAVDDYLEDVERPPAPLIPFANGLFFHMQVPRCVSLGDRSFDSSAAEQAHRRHLAQSINDRVVTAQRREDADQPVSRGTEVNSAAAVSQKVPMESMSQYQKATMRATPPNATVRRNMSKSMTGDSFVHGEFVGVNQVTAAILI